MPSITSEPGLPRLLRWLPFIGAGAAASIIGMVNYAEYVLSLKPCELCLMERWPWYAVLAISLLLLGSGLVARRLGALLLTIVLGGSTSFGLYHVAVEQHWIPGPTACTGRSLAGLDAAEALRLLTATPLTRCDEIQWQFLHLSLAGWNAVASFVLALMALAAAVQGFQHTQDWIRQEILSDE